MAKKSTPKKIVKNSAKKKQVRVVVESAPSAIRADLLNVFDIIDDPDIDETDLLTFKEYFSNGMNGTRAWMATHPGSQYDSASVSFHKWIRKAKISPIVERLRKELAMDIDEGVLRVAQIARGNISHFLKQGADGFTYLDLSNPEAQAHMYLIESMESKRERRVVGYGEEAEEFEGEWVKVKLHSAPAALKDILKMHGKFINRTEVTGKDGAPLIPPVDHEGYNESIDALADAVGDILSRKSTEANSEVGSQK